MQTLSEEKIKKLKQHLLDTIDEYDDPEDLIEDPENPFWTNETKVMPLHQIISICNKEKEHERI